MNYFVPQLTLVDLAGEDAGEYNCLLLNVESGEVDKGSATINLQVTFFWDSFLAVMTMRMRCTFAISIATD